MKKWQRSQQQQQITTTPNGGTNNTSTTAIYASFKGSSSFRSQPSRIAKSKDISYTSSPNQQVTPKRIQQWHTNLSLLKQYHTTHQTYNISRITNNGKYKPLADWLNRQRIQYTKYKNNEKNTLDDERVELLEGLSGVWWKRTSRSGLNGRSGGNNISRITNNGKYKPLADWLNRQRIQYTKYKNNEKNTLDDERVELLEGLSGVWWKRTSRSGLNGRSGGNNGGRSRKREASIITQMRNNKRSRGKDINIARQLWNNRNQDDDMSTDDSSIMDRMEREVQSDSSESEMNKKDYYDSYSDDDEYESDGRRGDGMVARGRRGGYESEEDSREEEEVDYYYNRKQLPSKKKKSSSTNNTNNTSSRRMSSLEQVAPHEKVSHHTKSRRRNRKSSKRRRDDDDDYDRYDDRRRRSYSPRHQSRHSLDRKQRSSFSSKRRPFYHNDERSLMSEDITSRGEDTTSGSLMIEEEHYIRRSSQKRKRVKRRNNDYHHHHRPHHHRGIGELRQKPMNEIIISPSTGTGTTAAVTQSTLSTLEQNKLLTEYGKLYEHQCYIYERKTRLELELRAIQSLLSENNKMSASIGMIGNGGGGGGNGLVGTLGSANKLLTAGDST